MNRFWPPLLATLALHGCGSTGISPMDGDTYMVGKTSPGGLVSAAGVIADIYKEANKFCSGKGQQVETVKLVARDAVPFRPASARLQFRCKTASVSTPQ